MQGWSEDEDEDAKSEEDDSQTNEYTTQKGRAELLSALRRDLRAAKEAGFKVGVLGDIKGGIDSYISISVRISKLGISDEAMRAWRLEGKRYLILLIHYSNYYQPLLKLVTRGYHGRHAVKFCVGTAQHYKPTFPEALQAFSKVDSEKGNSQQSINKDDGRFRGIFISRPLNELLNTKLTILAKHRLEHNLAWDGAERYSAGEYRYCIRG